MLADYRFYQLLAVAEDLVEVGEFEGGVGPVVDIGPDGASIGAVTSS